VAADVPFLNDLYRSRADKAGIFYVDVWDGFVDEDGRFAQSGLDFEGQTRRLRTGDGGRLAFQAVPSWVSLHDLIDAQLGEPTSQKLLNPTFCSVAARLVPRLQPGIDRPSCVWQALLDIWNARQKDCIVLVPRIGAENIFVPMVRGRAMLHDVGGCLQLSWESP
jgi:hypothetical protein